jgi:hypothetical protein
MRDEYDFSKAWANPYVLKADVAKVRCDVANLRADIKADLIDLSKQITGMQCWTMAAIVVLIAVLGAIQKLWS